MNENNGIRSLLSREALLIAVFPIFAYYSVYQYLSGYFGFYGAPQDLISVDISTFVRFGTLIMAFLYLVYSLGSETWSALAEVRDFSKRRLIVTSISLPILLGVLSYVLVDDWRKSAIFSGVFLGQYLWLIYTEKRSSPDLFPQWLVKFIILFTLLTITCQSFGYYSARIKTRYTVVTGYVDVFVISKSGDYFLCGTYDIEDQTFPKSFRLLPVRDSGLNIEYKRIGPLVSRGE